MDTNLTALKNFQVMLDGNKPYTYTIKQVEIKNALGAVITTLDEYFITNPNGENYKLYKTKEGNWYDLPEMIFSANKGVCRALKLASKYGLSLFITHQYIEQLHEKIRSAIFGNVGTLISFRIGATDAEYLAKEFYPVFNQDDLINLPRYSMYLKLMINGTTSKPFSAYTNPLIEYRKSYKERIIVKSQNTFGKERAEVEKAVELKNSKFNKEINQITLFSEY